MILRNFILYSRGTLGVGAGTGFDNRLVFT